MLLPAWQQVTQPDCLYCRELRLVRIDYVILPAGIGVIRLRPERRLRARDFRRIPRLKFPRPIERDRRLRTLAQIRNLRLRAQ